MSKAYGLLLGAIFLAAAVLRVAGIYDDFWLDEIWSGRIASSLARPWQVLTHPVAWYDNNHPLNTLLMWAQGHHPGWRMYRVPALAAGIASVLVVIIALRRRGRVEAVVGALLIGLSFPLILFSSEARGYALAVLFAVLAFDALERFLQSKGWIANLVFVVACILGFASHLTFVYFYAGAGVWSLARLVRERRHVASSIGQALRLHLVPSAWLGFLYLVFVRRLTIGGAPRQPLGDAVRDSLGALLGAGESINLAIFLILSAAFLFVLTILLLMRRRDDLWIFLMTTILAPVVVVAMQLALSEQGQPILHRYFLVSYVLFLIGLAILLSGWLRYGDARRIAAGAIIAVFLVLNLYHTVRFLQIGRGDYMDAVAYMASYPPGRNPPPVIVVSSDHPLRTGMVLEYYSHRLPPQQRMIIYDDSNVARLAPRSHGPPMWVVIHSNRRGAPPAKAFDQYVFEREFSYYGLSGYSWYLYRHLRLQ